MGTYNASLRAAGASKSGAEGLRALQFLCLISGNPVIKKRTLEVLGKQLVAIQRDPVILLYEKALTEVQTLNRRVNEYSQSGIRAVQDKAVKVLSAFDEKRRNIESEIRDKEIECVRVNHNIYETNAGIARTDSARYRSSEGRDNAAVTSVLSFGGAIGLGVISIFCPPVAFAAGAAALVGTGSTVAAVSLNDEVKELDEVRSQLSSQLSDLESEIRSLRDKLPTLERQKTTFIDSSTSVKALESTCLEMRQGANAFSSLLLKDRQLLSHARMRTEKIASDLRSVEYTSTRRQITSRLSEILQDLGQVGALAQTSAPFTCPSRDDPIGGCCDLFIDIMGPQEGLGCVVDEVTTEISPRQYRCSTISGPSKPACCHYYPIGSVNERRSSFRLLAHHITAALKMLYWSQLVASFLMLLIGLYLYSLDPSPKLRIRDLVGKFIAFPEDLICAAPAEPSSSASKPIGSRRFQARPAGLRLYYESVNHVICPISQLTTTATATTTFAAAAFTAATYGTSPTTIPTTLILPALPPLPPRPTAAIASLARLVPVRSTVLRPGRTSTTTRPINLEGIGYVYASLPLPPLLAAPLAPLALLVRFVVPYRRTPTARARALARLY
ncbi:hypothetical protein G7Y89_g9892 [Cudoniella acicularis]|uniref:Uncharacterized protein n=1 Tax=Cudoniella acicularis TaxID=354080 RepID=A0A8H4VZP7_9HELO|nr:hypothetical protein G7Y89_g9892 [Cudoniella acicularis]